MKKISLLLVLALLISVLPVNFVTANAATATYASYLLEDFEGETFNDLGGKSMYSTNFTTMQYNGKGPASDKCLSVSTSPYQANVPAKNYGPVFDMAVRNGYTYDISVWIKPIYDVPADDSVTFAFTSNGKTYTTKVSNAGLTLQKWTKVTATYTHTGTDASPVTGDFYILLGDGKTTQGISGGRQYALDDVTVMPRKYYVDQKSGVSGIPSSGYIFANDTAIPNNGTTSNGFRVENATSTLTSLSSSNSITVNGSTKKSGKYITITDDGTGKGKLIRESVDFRHGVEYMISVAMKANNDAAIGAVPEIYLDRSNRSDKINITSDIATRGYYIIDGTVPAQELTDGWREYRFPLRIDTPTFNDVNADFVVGLSGDGISGASFSVYGIKFCEHYSIRYEYTKVLTAGGGINATLVSGNLYNIDLKSFVTAGNTNACITQVLVPVDGEYALLKKFENWENEVRFQANLTPEQAEGMIMRVVPKDHNEYYGSAYTTEATITKEQPLTAVVEFDQPVWLSDMPELTATVRYNAPTGDEQLRAITAAYDSNGRLVSYEAEAMELVQGEGELEVVMDVSSTDLLKQASYAHVYVWDNYDLSPKFFDEVMIEKVSSGTFIYVDPTGTVNTTYGINNPLPTVKDAVNAFGKILKQSPNEKIYIVLHPGYHYVSEPISIDGSMTSATGQVKFVSYDKNNKGIISGGYKLASDLSYHSSTGLFRIRMDGRAEPNLKEKNVRHVYVNGIRATRARYDGPFAGAVNTSTYNEYGYVAGGGNGNGKLGVLKMNTDPKILNVARPQDLECVFFSLWTHSRGGVNSITDNGDGTMTFNMEENSWKLLNNMGNCHINTPSWIENALEFIDEPGEFYFDKSSGYLYYKPREGEYTVRDDGKLAWNKSNEVIIPLIDNYKGAEGGGALIEFIGTSSNKVKNITFDGVEFSHTTWSRPSTIYGHSNNQNNHKMDNKVYGATTDGDFGSPIEYGVLRSAAIDLMHTDNIDFLNCNFNRMGSTGVRMSDGVDNSDVIGCEFSDISGSAITMGEPYQGIKIKGNDSATQLAEDRMLNDITLANCYIHHVAVDYWSAAAISAGNPRNMTIANNEICYIPYSGMHIGYGWDSVEESKLSGMVIENNYIHDLFRGEIHDGGGIYTIGRTAGTKENPNIIRGNYIENVYVGGAGIYNDQGSSAWLVENNVVDIRNIHTYDNGEKWAPSKWCNVNFTSNSGGNDVPFYGKNVTWRNNYAAFDNAYTPYYARPTNGDIKGADQTNSFSAIYLDPETGKWPEAAYTVMDQAGISDEYKGNFRYGLQDMKVAQEVNMAVGEKYSNTPHVVGSKNSNYKTTGLTIGVHSSNEAVATATLDTITAKGTGSAVITYTVIEDGIVTKVSTIVTVK